MGSAIYQCAKQYGQFYIMPHSRSLWNAQVSHFRVSPLRITGCDDVMVFSVSANQNNNLETNHLESLLINSD